MEHNRVGIRNLLKSKHTTNGNSLPLNKEKIYALKTKESNIVIFHVKKFKKRIKITHYSWNFSMCTKSSSLLDNSQKE